MLPFFNWSLKKALQTEPDNFIRAKARIIYTILLFSISKVLVTIITAQIHHQPRQTVRALIALIIYLAVLKLLLSRPSLFKLISHLLMLMGTLIVWTNIFIFAHGINIATLQFVFMLALGGFYTLGTRGGIYYSLAAATPVIMLLFTTDNQLLYLTANPEVLASPGFEIIVILNFASIIVTHYLFYEASHQNLKEKEDLNKQLQASIAEATQLATSRANFLSTMSHELRTPLNSVVGITELLLADNPEERQKENLKILQFSSHDLLALINNILDFNKLDSDKLVLESVTFNLAEYARNICSVLRIKALDKKLDFVLDIDEQLENIQIISDPTRLSQVIYNLVGNAIKFTEKGSITVRLKCVHKNQHETDVMFSITDTGIGIHPERHETIFEMFSQAESHITRKYGGSGLGLAIVKQVLTLFNSSIHLNSTPGEGSTFYFTIPFATTIKNDEKKSDMEAVASDLGYLKILVAEDNELNRLIMKKQLDKLHIVPVIVENGKKALEKLQSEDFDAIFMDLHMPEMDGFEATRQVRQLPDAKKASTYIVAFTASVTEQQEIINTGFNDYLYKPVNMQDLRTKLEKIATL